MRRVSVAIQAHPARADVAEQLQACLGADAEIVYDPEPDAAIASPWRTYRHALSLTPPDAAHRLVIQEDAWIAEGFREAIEAASAARPDRVLVFFVSGHASYHTIRIRAAQAGRETWADLTNQMWLPVVATAWPTALIPDMLAWVAAQNYPAQFTADDEIAGLYLRARGLTALASVPSIVEHPDVFYSVASRGRRAANGRDPGRRAFLWIGDLGVCDARTLDWNSGPR